MTRDSPPSHRPSISTGIPGFKLEPFEDSLPALKDEALGAEEEHFEAAEETPNTASGSHQTPNPEENFHYISKYLDQHFEDIEGEGEE